MQSSNARINLGLALASVISLIASTGVSAASLHVTAADALSNKAYDLQFASATGTATALTPFTPLPASPRSSVRSLVYVANEATAKADLIAADNRTSQIVRYAGASGSPITVWNGTGAGPMSPLGMSADSFGNVFVVRGDQGHPELWVLKNNAGTFSAPTLIDKTSFVPAGSTPRLMDTLVVRTSVAGGLGVNDLLVLVSDGRVFRYSAASIASFLAGHGLIGTPTVLLPVSYFTQGHIPTSMAIWPADGSLLVTTVDGAVRRYSLTPTGSTALPNFATGLGSEATGNGQLLGLIRTFASSSGNYAVVDNPQRNKIYELGAPPPSGCPNLAVVCNAPLSSITTVANPVGLAVTDSSAKSLDCVNSNTNPGCALLTGGVIVGVSSATNNGSVIAVTCTVDDPRFNTGLGKCDGSTLLASSVCPNYPATAVPAYLCGASGASGHALTFLKFEEANGFGTAPNDLLVNIELSAESLVGAGGGIPTCPQLTMGWAPLSAEGTIPEGNFLTELTSHCGSTKTLTPGHSLMVAGVQMQSDAPGLVGLANDKFDRLSDTITAATNMSNAAQTALSSCVAYGKTLLNTSSLTATNRASCAAHEAFVCDQTVTANQFNNNPNKLSAYSAIKGRLENLIMHLDNRIVVPGSTPTWPQTDPLPGAVATCDVTAPTAPGAPAATEASSDGSSTTYDVSWTASTDSGTGTASDPGPYASGVQRYHVYLDNTSTEVTGSPTTSLSLQVTISDSTPAVHSIIVTADDNATGGNAPQVFNTSGASTASAQCTDADNNGACDVYPTPPVL